MYYEVDYFKIKELTNHRLRNRQGNRGIHRYRGEHTGLLDRAESLGNAEDRAEVESLRQDLQIRINQLNHYYTDHSLDDNIAIFHMLKLKLEKTLFLSRRSNSKNTVSSKVEQFEAQSSLFQEGDIKWLD